MEHTPQQDPIDFLATMHAQHAAEQTKHHRDEHHRPLVFPAPEPRLSVAERSTIRWAYHRTNGGVATVRNLRDAQLALLVEDPPSGPQGDERQFSLIGLRSRVPDTATDAFRRVAERGGRVIAAYDVKEQQALCIETTGGPPHFLPDSDPHPLALHLLVHDDDPGSAGLERRA
jgi:hypothetical protein